jgi:hypothetical protein
MAVKPTLTAAVSVLPLLAAVDEASAEADEVEVELELLQAPRLKTRMLASKPFVRRCFMVFFFPPYRT